MPRRNKSRKPKTRQSSNGTSSINPASEPDGISSTQLLDSDCGSRLFAHDVQTDRTVHEDTHEELVEPVQAMQNLSVTIQDVPVEQNVSLDLGPYLLLVGKALTNKFFDTQSTPPSSFGNIRVKTEPVTEETNSTVQMRHLRNSSSQSANSAEAGNHSVSSSENDFSLANVKIKQELVDNCSSFENGTVESIRIKRESANDYENSAEPKDAAVLENMPTKRRMECKEELETIQKKIATEKNFGFECENVLYVPCVKKELEGSTGCTKKEASHFRSLLNVKLEKQPFDSSSHSSESICLKDEPTDDCKRWKDERAEINSSNDRQKISNEPHLKTELHHSSGCTTKASSRFCPGYSRMTIEFQNRPFKSCSHSRNLIEKSTCLKKGSADDCKSSAKWEDGNNSFRVSPKPRTKNSTISSKRMKTEPNFSDADPNRASECHKLKSKNNISALLQSDEDGIPLVTISDDDDEEEKNQGEKPPFTKAELEQFSKIGVDTHDEEKGEDAVIQEKADPTGELSCERNEHDPKEPSSPVKCDDVPVSPTAASSSFECDWFSGKKQPRKKNFSTDILKYFSVASELDRYDVHEALKYLEKVYPKEKNDLEDCMGKPKETKAGLGFKKGDILFKSASVFHSESHTS